MQWGSRGPLVSVPVRTKAQERVVTLTTNSAFQVTLPPDLLEIRAVYQALNQDGSVSPRLVFVDPMEFYANNVIQVTGGRPINYTLLGKQEDAQNSEGLIEVQPGAVDIDLKVLYWTKIPPLTDDNSTNWILENIPNVYLHGALAEAFLYIRNDEMAGTHFAAYASLTAGLAKTEERSRHQGGPMAPRFSVQ